MTYDVYFHDDFDGRASAAIVLAFLESRGDGIGEFVPINFDRESEWKEESFFSQNKRPVIVVDFFYHPGAAMWFDHHPTTFKHKEWEENFVPGPYHKWDTAYASCAHLVYDAFLEQGFSPISRLEDLVRSSDIIDGARYASPLQTIEMKDPEIQIEHFVDEIADGKEPSRWLIEKMSQVPIRDIARDERVQKVMERVYVKRDEFIAFMRAHLVITGNVGAIDFSVSKEKLLDLRYAPYHFYPELLYFIFLKRHGEEYGVHVGVSPWRRDESQVNLGELCKAYGGGGHIYVGGLRRPSWEEATAVMKEIVQKLT